MKKHVLNEMVHYYEDAVNNFDDVMKAIQELNDLGPTDTIPLWEDWTASNDKTFIYGETHSFDLNQIRNMDEPYRTKSEFIYLNIMQSLYDVCRDYAKSVGDMD